MGNKGSRQNSLKNVTKNNEECLNTKISPLLHKGAILSISWYVEFLNHISIT